MSQSQQPLIPLELISQPSDSTAAAAISRPLAEDEPVVTLRGEEMKLSEFIRKHRPSNRPHFLSTQVEVRNLSYSVLAPSFTAPIATVHGIFKSKPNNGALVSLNVHHTKVTFVS